MRFGTPVICSDRASLPEVAGEAGLVCPLVASDWVKALDDVRDRRDELIAAGRARAQLFTADTSASELVEQYDFVVAATRGKQ
jgi:alpha-1,3-rhamnosyl/mannosyltransferase